LDIPVSGFSERMERSLYQTAEFDCTGIKSNTKEKINIK